MKILFADNWHFHRRNFVPIFEAIKKDSLPHQFETSRRSWWKAHGRYSHLTRLLKESVDFINQHDDWRGIDYSGINLWEITKAEFLCNALTQDHWHRGGIPNQSDFVFEFAVSNPQDRESLRLCLAAAHNWLLFWGQYLDCHPDISHVMVFSGSYIYTRSLMVVAKQRNIPILVAEHFFTGNDFYLEYRDKPIANNCGVQREVRVDSTLENKVGDVISSAYTYSRIQGMKNRNVPQSKIAFKHPWSNQNPIILIIGQVANDFSIIETPSDEISSIATYKQAITNLLKNTDVNLIFKAHPWERKRAPMFSPLTKTMMEAFIQSLPEADRARIVVAENESINAIFQVCDGVTGISSQGLLEACYYGFKPALIGDTFFSKKGFTQDIGENVNLFNDAFDEVSWKLSLKEYEQFKQFMGGMFTLSLTPNNEMASELIVEKLLKQNAKLSDKNMAEMICTKKINYIDLVRDIWERPYIWIRLCETWALSKFILPNSYK